MGNTGRLRYEAIPKLFLDRLGLVRRLGDREWGELRILGTL